MRLRFAILLLLLLNLTASWAANSAVFIMYHRFGEAKYPSTNITLEQFDRHLEMLRQGGYHVLPVPTILEYLQQGKSLPDKTVGILIDDAYTSVYDHAWPRLKDAGFPFTVFVATDPVDANYQSIMSWDQIRELQKAGVTIGHHSAAHEHMALWSAQQVREDTDRASKRFQAELGAIPTLYAYPYGEYSPTTRQAIMNSGFTAAFAQYSSPTGFTQDWFAIPRFALNEKYGDIDRFRLLLHTEPLPVSHLLPTSPIVITPNPPSISFRVIGNDLDLEQLNCYAADKGEVPLKISGRQVSLELREPFANGRSRVNCTLQKAVGEWYWLGIPLQVIEASS